MSNVKSSNHLYYRKNKLNGKKTDITDEINGMMNINEYLLAMTPKLTKLVDELHDAVTDGSLTDQDVVYRIKQLFKEFEQENT